MYHAEKLSHRGHEVVIMSVVCWHLAQSLNFMINSYSVSHTLEDLDHKLKIVIDREVYRKTLTFPSHESAEGCF